MAKIYLPYGNNTFDTEDLIHHIHLSRRDYIIQGQQACSLSKHTKPQSLDYWLRSNYAKQPDTKQAVNELIEQLVATKDFEMGKFVCPDTGRECDGIRVIEK